MNRGMLQQFAAVSLLSFALARASAQDSPRYVGPELIPNGGFEGAARAVVTPAGTRSHISGQIAEGWADNSSWAAVDVGYEQRSDAPHDGALYQRMTVQGITDGRAQLWTGPVTLEAGATYVLQAWLRSPTGTGASVILRQPGPPYETYTEAVASGRSKWQRVHARFRSLGDTPAVLLVIPDGVGTVDVDGVSLRAVSEGLGRKPQSGNLADLGRLGAGPQSGWQVDSQNCTWSADPASGPLGPGAAKLMCGPGGQCTASLPARYLRSGIDHTLALWARSDPPGARITVTVRANDDSPAFGIDAQPPAEWRRFQTHAPLKPSKDGRYYLQLKIQASNATLWLDGLSLRESGTPGPADALVGVGAEPAAPLGLVAGKEPERIRVRVAGATKPGCTLRLRAFHVDGRKEALKPIPLDRSGAWQRTITVPGRLARLNGMLRIEAQVVDAAGSFISQPAETLLARVPTPAPGDRPDSPFGVHVTLREPDVSVVSRLGFRWCRLHDASILTKWAVAEPQPGRWVFYDDQMKLARKHGLSILGMLCSSPPWENGHPNETGYFAMYYPPKDMAAWRSYVRTVVSHYKPWIYRWEVWNEPWGTGAEQGFFRGGTPAQYAALLKAAYEEAKRADPACTVLGIDTYPEFWDQQVLKEGALPYYDLLSFHRYESSMPGGPDDVFARVARRLRDEQARYGAPKPLEDTEGGPGTTGKGSFFSFADMDVDGDWSRWADQVPRYYLGCIAAGVKRFYLYSLHSASRFGAPGSWMLTEPGYLLKPLTVSTSILASFIEGAAWKGRVAPAPGVTAQLFEQTEARWYAPAHSLVAVLFSDGEDAAPLPRPLPSSVRCYDRWGNPVPPPTRASRSPVYLIASYAGRAPLLRALSGVGTRGR